MAKNVKIKNKNKNDADVKIKRKFNNVLCVILKESKGASLLWIKDKNEHFSFEDNTYFIVDDGTYISGMLRVLVFLEGVSVPIHHGYIKQERVKRQYKDRNTGKMKSVFINKIKGLEFDSKIINILLNRNLADEFTKEHMDLPNLAIIILLIINMLVGVANIGMWFA